MVDGVEAARHRAGEVDADRRHERAERRQHAGVDREHDAVGVEQLGDPAGMHRAGAAERQHGDTAQVDAVLDGVHPRRGRHVLVDDLVDARGGLDGVEGECAPDGVDRRRRSVSVEGHVAAEKGGRVEQPEDHVGVGDGRLRAAAPVRRRPRLGACGLRADLEQAELVGVGDRSAAGTDLDEIDRRDGHGKSGALLEPVDAGDLERRGQARLAVLDEAGLGRRAAHVEAQQSLLSEAFGEPTAGEGTGGRTGLDETDRGAGGVVGGHDTAVGQHHQHGAPEPLGGEPLLQLVEVRADHRHRRRVACRGHHAWVLAELRRHVGGDADGNGEFSCAGVRRRDARCRR